MSTTILRLSGVLLTGALLAGCAAGPATSEEGTSVVAAFYPFAFVADRVAGRHAEVTNLTAAGADPHGLELTPQQVARVAQADVLVYERGFQPAVDDAVGENAEGTVVEVTDVVATATGDGEAHEDGGAHEDGEAHEDGDHGHRHAGVAGDPHVWQDPTKLAEVARAVGRALAEVDPAHAAAYERNTQRLVANLQTLDQRFRQGLADCERRTIVTSHAAFGHLAHRYDLRMVPIAGISPDAEPSPGRLARLQQVVADTGVTTVFSETLASPELARTLAAEVGVDTAVLDPIEGLSEATADEDYFSLMRANLATLRQALGCR